MKSAANARKLLLLLVVVGVLFMGCILLAVVNVKIFLVP